jgi:hypothetical protein
MKHNYPVSLPDDILIYILMFSKSLPVNNVMRQIKKTETRTSIEKKKITKISNDKLNYREIYYLAKLYLNNINNFKNNFLLNILKEGLNQSTNRLVFNNFSLLSHLKNGLLNPTKKLFLTNNKNLIGIQSDIHFVFYINPINDDCLDFQLNFIFFCIDIKKTISCLTLLFVDINFQIFKNSFNTIMLALKLNIPIRLLMFKNNQINDKVIEIVEALETNTTLYRLAIDNNRIGSYGVREIAKVLKKNTTLKMFSLNSNKIFPSGISALADALKQNTTLTTLNLKFTSIDKDGAILIADALKQNTTLLKLDIEGNNNIRNGGANALAEALKINTTLLKLNIVQRDYIWNSFNTKIFTPYLSRVTM